MEKTNEILTIAGERVEVRYESDFYEACGKCCFHNIFVACNVRTLCHGCPCDKYTDDKNRRFAYFVRAEEIEVTPQEVTLIPSNEDEDKAAEEACAKCPISGRCFVEDKGRKDACDYLRGVKAGIAYERERLMEETNELEGFAQDFENYYDTGVSPYLNCVRGDIKNAVIAGAKKQQQLMMKEAVETTVYYDFENRLAVKANLPKESPHKFCDKVSVIIIKKEDEK